MRGSCGGATFGSTGTGSSFHRSQDPGCQHAVMHPGHWATSRGCRGRPTFSSSPLQRWLSKLPQGPLIAAEHPSFFDLFKATSYFLGFPDGAPGGRAERGITYRHQDLGARITKVVFGTERVQIEVDGNQLTDTVLEVAGTVTGQALHFKAGSPQAADFVFPGGLPRSAWVLVRRGGSWPDRRFLRWPYATDEQDGVEEEPAEVDPAWSSTSCENGRASESSSSGRCQTTPTTSSSGSWRPLQHSRMARRHTVLFGITDEYKVIGVPRSGG